MTVVTAGSALAVLAGCGSSSSGGSPSTSTSHSTTSQSATTTANESTAAPAAELADAFHAVTDGSSLTTTLSLDESGAALVRLSKSGGGTSDDLTPAQADVIANAKITIETIAPDGKTVSEGATATTPAGYQFALTGSSGGTTYFSFIATTDTLYALVDLKDMLHVAGQDATYRTIVKQAAAFPPFAQALVAGKYISLPFSTAAGFVSFLKGVLQGSATGIPDVNTFKTAEAKIFAAVERDVSVTRTSTGSTDELTLRANIRDVAKDLLTAVRSAVPQLASRIDPSEADQAPDQDLSLTAAITGGVLQSVSFDFAQFAPHAARNAKQQRSFAALPKVILGFSKSGPAITAPPGVTPITLQDLTSFFATLGQEAQ
jgi:hypothetical protein